MMEQQKEFSVSAVALSVLTAALADGFWLGTAVRQVLLLGALNTLLLTAVLWFAGSLWQNPRKWVMWAMAILFAAELARTFLQAQQVCWKEFHSMALIGFLPLLLWAGWRLQPAGWNAPARVLWWFVCLGAVLCIAGSAGQAQWWRLVEAGAAPAALQQGRVLLYAEYLAWPLLCPGAKPRQAAALPWLAFAAQAGAAVGIGAVFGGSSYPQLELLRGLSVGVFSRMDALLLLVWLLCAVFRMGFLCTAVRLAVQHAAAGRRKAAE